MKSYLDRDLNWTEDPKPRAFDPKQKFIGYFRLEDNSNGEAIIGWNGWGSGREQPGAYIWSVDRKVSH